MVAGEQEEHAKVKHNHLDWEDLRAKSLRKGGFGDERVELWPKLLHVSKNKALKDDKLLMDLEEKAHQDERQIGLDTNRSFVLYPVDSKYDRKTLQANLHQLLVSLFRKRPKLNYFQGFHDIVTVFYLTLPSELQLVCVEKLSLHRLRDSMGSGLEPVVGLLRVTKNLIRLADPEYGNLLEKSSSLPFFALSNLLTLFSHDMPTLPLIQHVFDYLLCRPPIAAVYLATAVILSRKEDVIRLLEEEEEGMVHSLLSSLPNLADASEKVEDDSILSKVEQLADPDTTFFKQEDESNFLSPLKVEDDSSASIHLKDNLTTIKADEKYSLDNHPKPSDEQSDSQCQAENQDLPHLPNPRSEPISEVKELPPQGADGSSSSDDLIIGGDQVGLSRSLEIKDEDDIPEDAKLPPSASLLQLLADSDALYKKYPPSHSMLSLSNIMGPQSVIFTWSESSSKLPSDHTAEAMVSHPELVVYPYIDLSQQEKESKLEKESSSGKGHRKRPKLKKSPFGQIEKKTMLAGTVIVLGVAMVVYGIKARSSSGLLH